MNKFMSVIFAGVMLAAPAFTQAQDLAPDALAILGLDFILTAFMFRGV